MIKQWTEENVLEQLKLMLAKSADFDIQKIDLHSNLYSDLGMDSLDRYEFIYYVEEEFGIGVPDEIIQNFETVQEVYDKVKEELGI